MSRYIPFSKAKNSRPTSAPATSATFATFTRKTPPNREECSNCSDCSSSTPPNRVFVPGPDPLDCVKFPTVESYLELLRADDVLNASDLPPIPPIWITDTGQHRAEAWSRWWEAVDAQRRRHANRNKREQGASQ